MNTNKHQSSQLLRVGVAGLGRSGWGIHCMALARHPDLYTITHVADADEERQREAVSKFGCNAHNQYEAMIQQPDIDLVVVATPNHLHADHAIAALRSGKHVVCEKPMAKTTDEADRMIKAADDASKILAIFQNQRYAPHLQQVLEVIGSGVLGRIVQIRIALHGFSRRWDWQTLRRYDGGTLSNTGPHFLDHALQVFGENEPDVFCHLDRALTLGDADDHNFIMLRRPGAPLVQIELTSACAFGQDLWLVMGTNGTLKGNASELHWRVADFSHLPPRIVEDKSAPARAYNSEEIQWAEYGWNVLKEQSIPQWTHDQFYQDLHQTLSRGRALKITPQSIRRQISIIETCRAWEAEQLS